MKRTTQLVKWSALLALGIAGCLGFWNLLGWMTVADNRASARYEEAQERRERESGIRCAEPSHSSGNVCRVEVGDRECVAVLPDGETSPKLDTEALTRCYPAPANG